MPGLWSQQQRAFKRGFDALCLCVVGDRRAVPLDGDITLSEIWARRVWCRSLKGYESF